MRGTARIEISCQELLEYDAGLSSTEPAHGRRASTEPLQEVSTRTRTAPGASPGSRRKTRTQSEYTEGSGVEDVVYLSEDASSSSTGPRKRGNTVLGERTVFRPEGSTTG
jgi:hypothetical protein